MTRDDVIRSTAAHIKRVGELLSDRIHDLALRAVRHDSSKWSPEEWPAFEEATPKLADLEYGSEEYKASLRAIKPAIEHHQQTNTHHPEFYANGVDGMDLLDLVEMICDWKAAGERHHTGDIRKSLEINRDRFKIEDQLHTVLANTIDRWFPVLPDGADERCFKFQSKFGLGEMLWVSGGKGPYLVSAIQFDEELGALYVLTVEGGINLPYYEEQVSRTRDDGQ